MYVDTCHYIQNGKPRTRVLLRTSFRQKGKVKHKTIGNLTNCRPDEIEAIRFVLKHKKDLAKLQAVVGSRSKMRKGPSVGAVLVLEALAKRLGIGKALGPSRQGQLALWQVMARIIGQGSRLSAVRLAGRHAVCDVLGLEAFDEDDLYENLDWLDKQQARVEDSLFRQKKRESLPELFLYDVTSSYFEGQCNELAEFGHNRDGKRGKKQIVIGLLTDEEGDPVSVQVFRGNLSDMKTFGEQVWKVKERFGVESVTMVGDRGMIKHVQIEQLPKYFHYITAITKPEIETLLKKNVFQMEFFDEAICEVEWDGIRYVLRRNPVRAEEVMATRKDKEVGLEKFVDRQNQYLVEHPGAAPSIALRKVRAKIEEWRAQKWIEVKEEGRHLVLRVDEEKLDEISRLDGCYVIKTDLPATATSAQTVHDRYKDLSEVEWAFRSMKTTHLEIRPHYVRRASRTRGHVFVVMLAYKIVRYLRKAWRELDITVEEGVTELSTICSTELLVGEKCCGQSIPEPDSPGKELLNALRVTLPDAIRRRGVIVATRKKLAPRR